MNFLNKVKELLKIKKNELDEFSADFEDHEVSDSNVYRLHYINYHNIESSYYSGEGINDIVCKKFILPNGMDKIDSFKVLSYLMDFINKNLNIQYTSSKTINYLDKALDFERFGFKRVESEEQIDLFIVTGRIRRFLSSNYYNNYFNWYIPNITKKEVEVIYNKCGMKFVDLVFEEKKEKTKQLILPKRN